MATILLVEDNRLVRLVLREALVRAGHLVLDAGSGGTALGHLASHLDAALIDHDLPDMTGPALLGEMRRRVGADVPAVVMTACWTEAGVAAAKATRACRYVEKPLELEDLVAVVEEVLAHPDCDGAGRVRPGAPRPPTPWPPAHR